MFAQQLHGALALATALAVGIAAILSALRLRVGGIGVTLRRVVVAFAMVGAATAATGLAMLLLGDRPREWLHFLYGGFALAALPYGSLLARRWTGRRAAWALLAAALLTGVLVFRLYATG